MSVATTGRAYAARWPRARTAWQLVSAEFLKVRKRRGLVTLAVMLTAGAIVAAGTVLALLHAQDPAKYGPPAAGPIWPTRPTCCRCWARSPRR